MDPTIYADIAFNYDHYLEPLFRSGGYAFRGQMVSYIQCLNDCKEQQAEKIYYRLRDLKFIGTKPLVNTSFLYLETNALKYYYLKDREEDFSAYKPRNLPYRRIDKRPSDRVLLFAAMKFQKLVEEGIDYSKKKLLAEGRAALAVIHSDLPNIESSYKKMLMLERLEEEKVQHGVKVMQHYYDLSKVLFQFSFSDGEEGVDLYANIIDVSFKNPREMAMHIVRGLSDMGISLRLTNDQHIRSIHLYLHTVAVNKDTAYLDKVKRTILNFIRYNMLSDYNNIIIEVKNVLYPNLYKHIKNKNVKKAKIKEKHEEAIEDITKRLVKKKER